MAQALRAFVPKGPPSLRSGSSNPLVDISGSKLRFAIAIAGSVRWV